MDENQTAEMRVIAIAEAEIEKLSEELKKLDNIRLKISEWQTIIENAKRLGGALKPEAGKINPTFKLPDLGEMVSISSAAADLVMGKKRRRKRTSGGSLRDKAKELLKQVGHPMRTPEIAEGLYGADWRTAAPNSLQVLRGMFKNNADDFWKIDDGEYGLPGWRDEEKETAQLSVSDGWSSSIRRVIVREDAEKDSAVNTETP